ncbi:MAG: STAS domain-containing protein [Selenomonadaceae bacterium]|nr:STAS domain-containing protein [Selenomonadaceae bacterium]MBR1579490.1 STAS domain-containing protein [Selenomonadaceae bacterium]
MDINKQSEGTTLTIKLSGRLDAVSARDLDKVVGSSLDGVKDLIFDLADLSYVASAGLRVLFVAQKKMNKQGSMKLLHVRPEVKQIFEVTRFVDFFTIVE